MFSHLTKVHLQQWINENRQDWGQRRHIWDDSDFSAFVTIGPNTRRDFHINPGDEFFYQIEGELNLHYMKAQGQREVAVVGPGEVFLLPAGVPHSPRREAGSWTLAVERKAHPGEVHHTHWYCEQCNGKLYAVSRAYGEPQGPTEQALAALRADEKLRTCRKCGYISVY